jgi:hypothetical protein
LIRFDKPKHPIFCQLIERVKRQGQEENEFHVDRVPLFPFVVLSGVEESLTKSIVIPQ